MTTVGEVDHKANGFDPLNMLNEWETGTVRAGALAACMASKAGSYMRTRVSSNGRPKPASSSQPPGFRILAIVTASLS